MKRSKLIILTILGAYLLLLGHLTFPAIEDILPVNHSLHVNCGHHNHHHHSNNHCHDDFHDEDSHHCVYCCDHPETLEVTLNDSSFKLSKLNKLSDVVFTVITNDEPDKNESTQIYLQNVFKLPRLKHLISPNNFRAPPQV